MLKVIIIFVIAFCIHLESKIVKIPLQQGYDDKIKAIPILFNFSHSNVYAPYDGKNIQLQDLKLQLTISHHQANNIQIGLKYPSVFITAVAATYNVDYQSVQIGKQQQGLFIILFDQNYVESRDIWKDGQQSKAIIKYNYDNPLNINGKPVRLIQGNQVQALNKISIQNQLNFRYFQQNSSIVISGKVQNMPQISFKQQDYLFKITIKQPIIYYIPALKNPKRQTLVGFRSLQQFNKIKFSKNGQIIFKRTSLHYQVYLFIAYFTAFAIYLIYNARKSLFDSTVFVKNILKWLLLRDRLARIQVLKTQLQ